MSQKWGYNSRLVTVGLNFWPHFGAILGPKWVKNMYACVNFSKVYNSLQLWLFEKGAKIAHNVLFLPHLVGFVTVQLSWRKGAKVAAKAATSHEIKVVQKSRALDAHFAILAKWGSRVD